MIADERFSKRSHPPELKGVEATVTGGEQVFIIFSVGKWGRQLSVGMTTEEARKLAGDLCVMVAKRTEANR